MGEWQDVKFTLKDKIWWMWNMGKLPPKVRARALTKEQLEATKIMVEISEEGKGK